MSQEKGKIGRPRKEFSWEQFEKLCGLQCTRSEIAGFFDIHEDTLSDKVKELTGETFTAIYKRLSHPGKISIRRKQFALADKEHAQMLIWLGKQYLNQSDKVDSSHTVEKGSVNITLDGEKKEGDLF